MQSKPEIKFVLQFFLANSWRLQFDSFNSVDFHRSSYDLQRFSNGYGNSQVNYFVLSLLCFFYFIFLLNYFFTIWLFICSFRTRPWNTPTWIFSWYWCHFWWAVPIYIFIVTTEIDRPMILHKWHSCCLNRIGTNSRLKFRNSLKWWFPTLNGRFSIMDFISSIWTWRHI